MLEPELLRTFVAIAESGSFTEAAKRVHRTQSAVSMQMKRLEEELRRPVFVRDGRSVRITAAGETLLGHARRILKAHQDALALFRDGGLEGSVSVGTPDEYAVSFLPAVLTRFAETHPLVHVDVVCEPSMRLGTLVADGTVDLALITRGHGDEGGMVLWEEPVVWVTSARHCAHELDPMPLALFHAGCRFRQWAIDALADVGRPYRIAYSSVSLAAIDAAIRAGLAVSVLQLGNVGPGLRMLGKEDGFPALPTYQVALKRAPQATGAAVDRFVEHMLEQARLRTGRQIAA